MPRYFLRSIRSSHSTIGKSVACAIIFACTLNNSAFTQIACTGYTLTSTTTELWTIQGSCPISIFPILNSNTAWTGWSAGGFITHTFDSPQTNVNIRYYHINNDDYGTITVNGGGAATFSIVAGCCGLVGNVIGPYTGVGIGGPVEINVVSTLPFTTLTLTNNSSASGFIAACTSTMNLSVDLGPDTTICMGDSFILNATTPNCTYLWQDNTTLPTFTVMQAGTYWVEIADSLGNTVSDTIAVDYFALPTVDLGTDTTVCTSQNVLLDATLSGMTYLWQDNSTAPTFNVVAEGVYWVSVSDSCGNSAIDTIIVNYLVSPTVDLGNDLLICDDESALLVPTTTFASTFLWDDASTQPTLTVSLDGIYWLEVTNICGLAIDSIEITTELCLSILEMPNVFTPNNDGTNDLFIPSNIVDVEDVNIVITNRWGQVVYQNNDVLTGWNGKFRGNDCEEGTYFWLVNYKTAKGEDRSIHGFVNLQR